MCFFLNGFNLKYSTFCNIYEYKVYGACDLHGKYFFQFDFSLMALHHTIYRTILPFVPLFQLKMFSELVDK